MDIYRNITTCRICKSEDLVEVLDFGKQYLATNFIRTNDGHPLSDVKLPLTVVLCRHCGMVQLRETVTRALLYREYFYRSGTNPMMRAALQDVVRDVLATAPLRDGDTVLDMGANDGTMLSFYPANLRRVGIEPATNIDWSRLDGGIRMHNGFFTAENAERATGGAKCRVVTSVAMLYSVEDLHQVVADVKSILAEDGLWLVQASYLPATIEKMAFYDVCHEHLYYFTLRSVGHLLREHGLRIVHATTNDVNGGSIRLHVTHESNPVPESPQLQRLVAEEEAMKLKDLATYREFARRVDELREKVNRYIHQEMGSGGLVIGLGASTKGNVLLQYFGIDKQTLPYISERNPEKVSLRTLGTDIELISEEKARELNPSDMLVLIHSFKDEIVRREEPYLRQGGRLLFPLPYCHLVTKDGEQRL
jgi:hypothetical protein